MMTFSAIVIDFPCPLQGNSSLLKLLHERHRSARHNFSKKTATALKLQNILSRSLCFSPGYRKDARRFTFFASSSASPELIVPECDIGAITAFYAP